MFTILWRGGPSRSVPLPPVLPCCPHLLVGYLCPVPSGRVNACAVRRQFFSIRPSVVGACYDPCDVRTCGFRATPAEPIFLADPLCADAQRAGGGISAHPLCRCRDDPTAQRPALRSHHRRRSDGGPRLVAHCYVPRR